MPDPAPPSLDELAFGVAQDAKKNNAKWGPLNSAHEGFGVLLEEVDELKAHVWMKQKNRDLEAMKSEALDIASVALRIAFEVCNEQVGRR